MSDNSDLKIAINVLQKMIADAIAKGDKQKVQQLDGVLKLVNIERKE